VRLTGMLPFGIALAIVPPGGDRELTRPAALTEASQSHFIGGCRAYEQRASYQTLRGGAGCNEQTACAACGQDACARATLPSGMTFPRHNVPQHMGNAPWDAKAGLGDGVAAMLGDPFAFVVSPELDALRRLFRSPSIEAQQLAAQVGAKWNADPRYSVYRAAEYTRTTFMTALSEGGPHGRGLTSALVLGSSTWARLSPSTMKGRLQQALESGRGLTPEVATCAAIYVMDAVFAQRSVSDVLGDLQGEVPPSSMPAANRSLWQELYAGAASAMPSSNGQQVSDDPHNVVYTTVYPQNAHGFYGGNLSLTFSSVDRGSGIDAQWADEYGCPAPGEEAVFCSQRNRRSGAPPVNGARRTVADNPDAGELRTPNYKEPRELTGLNLFAWNQEPKCVFPDPSSPSPSAEAGCDASFWAVHRRLHGSSDFMATPYDLSTLVRPTAFSFQRFLAAESAGAQAHMAYVLAPGATTGGVYGIDRIESSDGRVAFTAAPSPPFSMPDTVVADHVPVTTTDLPPRTVRSVPVWGVLHSCNATNLFAANNDRVTPSAVTCAAAAALRQHRPMREPLFSTLFDTRLPDELAHALASLRVWPSDTTIELGAEGGLEPPTARRLQVCVLSFAAALRLEREGAC